MFDSARPLRCVPLPSVNPGHRAGDPPLPRAGSPACVAAARPAGSIWTLVQDRAAGPFNRVAPRRAHAARMFPLRRRPGSKVICTLAAGLTLTAGHGLSGQVCLQLESIVQHLSFR